eukprot:gnl/MRDRNA2_/MRDRNA2_85310_c0_seq4.p1 gnl/MRDRNA2_/MRDRNA2_85310_c0~~gnl/MRDRNA2_/MRDRNA2_85310_c0_seq4.p1  ORF type:complete len:387 (-),score=45.27 gnl/MRDRNA2_/MRDRNA2_85310_c0_seq4:154-1314(-)
MGVARQIISSCVLEFGTHGLGNLAWAFGTPGISESPVTGVSCSFVSGLVFTPSNLQRGRNNCVLRPVEVFALVNAFAVAGHVEQRLLQAASVALEQLAQRKDAHDPPAALPVEVMSQARTPSSEEPCVLWDSQHHYVLWKPANWTVSVVAVDADVTSMFSEILEKPRQKDGALEVDQWVIKQFSHMLPIAADQGHAHGFIHRLDRQTSGLLVVAKSYWGYYWGKLQWAALRVQKEYVCLVHGWLDPDLGRLEDPLVVSHQAAGGYKSHVRTEGRRARTEVLCVAHLVGSRQDQYSLVEIQIATGRKHQIRAHLSHHGHPLVGDEKYGGMPRAWCPRMFLHAHHLQIQDASQPLDARCPLPADLRRALAALQPCGKSASGLLEKWGC